MKGRHTIIVRACDGGADLVRMSERSPETVTVKQGERGLGRSTEFKLWLTEVMRSEGQKGPHPPLLGSGWSGV